MIVLEYFEPYYIKDGSTINVGKVIHGYEDMFGSGYGQAGGCNVCSQGDDWCVEKRATAMILLSNNTRWCSGSLINNTREDLTPYFLSAFHCADADKNKSLSQSEINDAQTWIFRFKYWSPTCKGNDANGWVSINGAAFKAGYSISDFLLMQLITPPPPGLGVLYAGWSNQNVASISGASISHPRGDVMKIALYNQTITQQTFLGSNDWRVVWAQGTVEPTSSGAPLFNSSRLVIGQVHGGTTTDICTSNDHAYFGRFDVSWNGGGTSSSRLKDWLDPGNTGISSIKATSPTIYLINRKLTTVQKFAALAKLHIEGKVSTSGTICQPSSVVFSTEPGSNIVFKAGKSVEIKTGTIFKSGSVVSVSVGSIQCGDNLTEGDYVGFFCNTTVSKRDSNGEEFQSTNTDIASNEAELSIFPNPSNGKFTIASTLSKGGNVEVFSIKGEKVFSYSSANSLNGVDIDISNRAGGIYLVKVSTPENVWTKRVVVE